jgi:hypothetical protein
VLEVQQLLNGLVSGSTGASKGPLGANPVALTSPLTCDEGVSKSLGGLAKDMARLAREGLRPGEDPEEARKLVRR